MKNFIKNKKGEGTAFGWIIALVVLVTLGGFFILLNHATTNYLIPSFESATDTMVVNGNYLNTTTKTELNDMAAEYKSYFDFLPFLIFIIIIIWVGLNAVRKYREEQFQ